MSIRTNNILLLALIPVLLFMIYMVETVLPEVTLTRIESPQLHKFFRDAKIVHLSDIHLVKWGWREQLVLSEIEKVQPDLILLTGDYVEEYSDFTGIERFFKRLTAVSSVIATLGNNDYCCLKQLEKAAVKAGVILLKNESVILRHGDDSIYVVGLEDNFLFHDDYFSASLKIPPHAPRIVLGHAPSIAEELDPDGINLLLSGHLHGGQVVIPCYGPLALNVASKYSLGVYLTGLYDVNGITLFSNRGIGTSIAPFRFLARPEIAVLKFDP